MKQRFSIVTSLSLITIVLLFFALVSTDAFAQNNIQDDMFMEVKKFHSVEFKVGGTSVSRADQVWMTDSLKPAFEAVGENACIVVRAASSPEGAYQNNLRLTNARLRSVLKVLDDLGIKPNRVVTSSAPEDYAGLVSALRADGEPAASLVDSLVNAYRDNPQTLKAKFQILEQKRPEIRRYYSRLRAVSLMIIDGQTLFDQHAPVAAHAESSQPIVTTPAIIKDDEGKVNAEQQTTQSSGVSADTVEMLDVQQTGVEQGTAFEQHAESIALAQEIDLPRRHVLAISTNMLYNRLFLPSHGPIHSPNLALEFYPRKGRFTYLAEFHFPDWQNLPSAQDFWRLYDCKLSSRFYTRKYKVAPKDAKTEIAQTLTFDFFRGFFVGAYLQAGNYNYAFNNKKGREGEYVGAGLQVGYTLPLCRSSRWRLEFTASGGTIISKYDLLTFDESTAGYKDGKYRFGWHCDTKFLGNRDYYFRWFGPTELGVRLTYDLLYKRIAKKGVSFNRSERP